jgi:hypothetical protein
LWRDQVLTPAGRSVNPDDAKARSGIGVREIPSAGDQDAMKGRPDRRGAWDPRKSLIRKSQEINN